MRLKACSMVALSMCWASPALCADWWMVAAADDVVTFVDRDRVADADGGKSAWVLNIFKHKRLKNLSYMQLQTLFSCSDKTVERKYESFYSYNGELLFEGTPPNRHAEPAIPDTQDDYALKFVCGEQAPLTPEVAPENRTGG